MGSLRSLALLGRGRWQMAGSRGDELSVEDGSRELLFELALPVARRRGRCISGLWEKRVEKPFGLCGFCLAFQGRRWRKGAISMYVVQLMGAEPSSPPQTLAGDARNMPARCLELSPRPGTYRGWQMGRPKRCNGRALFKT